MRSHGKDRFPRVLARRIVRPRMDEPRGPRWRTPWAFVPTLNVLQGIPYFVVQAATNTYLAVLEFSPKVVGHVSSDATLPWMLKALWSPLVDLFGTKRAWILGSAVAVSVASVALAHACTSQDVVASITIAALLLAIASATNDVATDGFYIHALTRRQQEAFVGVRGACFRLGRVAVMGGAVSLAGWLASSRGLSHPVAYAFAFGSCAALYALVTVWHAFTLPRPASDGPTRGAGGGWSSLREAVSTYFTRPGIGGALAFILLYRLAELLLSPMISPFLLGSREKGGLAVPSDRIGAVYGTFGVLALVIGGIVGGATIARFGLRRCLWPLALAMHAPNVLYAWAAHARPGIVGATAVVGVEQFGYGLGFAAYMAVLLSWSRDSRYSTTHYAISTGIMGFTAWIAGRYSGDLVEAMGFETFFWVVCALGLLGLATLPFAPTGERREPDATGGPAR